MADRISTLESPIHEQGKLPAKCASLEQVAAGLVIQYPIPSDIRSDPVIVYHTERRKGFKQ